jgi:TRAP-type C4-dicarboxylate transport system permease small subunit
MRSTVHKNFRVYRYLMLLLKSVLVVLSSVLVLIVFGNVVGRYVFNYSLAWAEEASRFLFIWTVFIGAVLTNEKYEHMHLDMLVQWLPGKPGRMMQLLAYAVMLFVFGILIRGGVIATLDSLSWESPALEIPYGLVYSIVPFCCAVMFYQTLVWAFQTLRELRRPGKTG